MNALHGDIARGTGELAATIEHLERRRASLRAALVNAMNALADLIERDAPGDCDRRQWACMQSPVADAHAALVNDQAGGK